MVEVEISQQMSPKERIEHLIKVLGLKGKADFCRKILGDVKQGQNVTNYTRDEKPIIPKDSFWQTIAERIPDINKEWLYTGFGAPYYPGLKAVQKKTLEQVIAELREKLEQQERELAELREVNTKLVQEKETVLKLAQLALPGKSEGVADCLFVDLERANDLLNASIIERIRTQCVKPRQVTI